MTPTETALRTYRRHALPVRVMHWINVVAVFVLLTSGLQIFNAHPALYWGKSSYTGRPPVLEMGMVRRADGTPKGVTRILGHDFDTTGVLGLSTVNGQPTGRGFPAWATVPDVQWLAMGRRWHFFFAWVLVLNGIAYLAYAIASRHVARDLAPTAAEMRGIGRSMLDHLMLRHARGEAATRYNVLQKLAYLAIAFVVLPLLVMLGLGMSPRLDAAFPWWPALFGGRQSVRTLHFVLAFLVVAFVLVHVFQVIVTGPFNNLRSMITGRYRIPPEKDPGR